MATLLDRIWYGAHPLRWPLWPLSLLFALLSAARRALYRWGLLSRSRLPVPVIVVGNISVGGTGKSPLVIWLVQWLQQQGWTPGIVSRGYGGRSDEYPLQVTANSNPAAAGDEPVMLARRSGCPVVVDPLRARAAQALVSSHAVDIIVSDDGLQHYALQRDIEIVVVDAQRRYGNGMLLPAGPLRESRRRLQSVDAVLVNGASAGEAGFALQPGALRAVTGDRQRPLAEFSGTRVHAIAGIGNPERFFRSLEQAGLRLQRHAFADHHPYLETDIRFDDADAVIMTEKDAIKCAHIADERHWYLPVDAVPNAAAREKLEQLLNTLESVHG